jgi:hypothetical protein
MDSWYLSSELVQALAEYKKDWVSLRKRNRNLETQSFQLKDAEGQPIVLPKPHIKVEELVPLIPSTAYRKVEVHQQPYWCFTFCARIPDLGKVRLVISFDNPELMGTYAVLITNRTDWSTKQILAKYLQRWPIEVDLGEGNTRQSPINIVTNLENYQYRFAPRPPRVESITAINNQLEIRFNLNEENSDQVTVNVYRDGELVATRLSGQLTTWRDHNSQGVNSPSYCYNLESVYISSGTISQRSSPFCCWGSDSNHIYVVNADQFSAIGGNLSSSHGRKHFENWGAPGDSITVNIQTHLNGRHAIQVIAGNGSGPINTGITCAVKHLQMKNLQNEQIVADGYLVMPQLGTWDRWSESSVIFTEVDLVAGQNYEIKIFGDDQAINMSSFAHNENYTGGNGGSTGASNYVNIAQVKLLKLN